ncbi:hypothetical protein L1987_10197 [Smallanthus sonchifolius]|uniref:Uncharacterized protein n=1 Tax=Smallanthus sonchifolius TaxID=185202 RepID=A0ACB9JRR8_9ASTR|nr:hypothetical protein L1987_10197 [Smallanthus sonchifolius]
MEIISSSEVSLASYQSGAVCCPLPGLVRHVYTCPFLNQSPSFQPITMPTRPAGPMSQDWEPVVLHKSKPKAQVLRDAKAVNQALRTGAQVQTVKKFDGGTNKKAPATAVYARS